jgi:hypothetical protein
MVWSVITALSLIVNSVNRTEGASLKLRFRRLWGTILGIAMGHYGSCLRCYMTWAVAKPHIILVDTQAGSFFSICKHCYEECSPEERFKYHMMRLGGLIAIGYRPQYGPLKGRKRIVNLEAEAIRQAVYKEAHMIAPDPEWEEVGVA